MAAPTTAAANADIGRGPTAPGWQGFSSQRPQRATECRNRKANCVTAGDGYAPADREDREALQGYQDDDLRCKLDVALRALDLTLNVS
jgi:hypothetical protein